VPVLFYIVSETEIMSEMVIIFKEKDQHLGRGCGSRQRGGAQFLSRLGMPISAQTRENLARTVSLIFINLPDQISDVAVQQSSCCMAISNILFLSMPTLIVPFGILCQVKCQW
jgi:hypothetical protein